MISDGREKIYLVGQAGSPPQLQQIGEAAAGPDPVVSPIIVRGASAVAATKHGRLVRFNLPSLATAGETQLSAPVTWGPYPAGDGVVLATAAGQLTMVAADGSLAWNEPIEKREPVGAPLTSGGNLLIAYRGGLCERRALADGALAGNLDVAQSIDAGPVAFAGRLVLAAHDGTLLIVDQP